MEDYISPNSCPYCPYRGHDENDVADHIATMASDPAHAEVEDLDFSLDDIDEYVKESDWL